MKYYLAPLEGVTTYVFRNAYHQYFRPMDKYFTPFIVPHKNKKFNARELKELSPEHNKGLYVVPQLLTNQAEEFVKTAKEIQEFGYDEINLNLGCPSGTVVAKNKGSGFLALTEELDAFLEQIYSELDMKISIKTRIGKESQDEFYRLLEIYNKYPVSELIIHPRVQTEYYKGKPHWEMYREAINLSKHPLCYNGDIFSTADYKKFSDEFPETDTIMCGRGVVANPGLINLLDGGNGMDQQMFLNFHDMMYAEYQEISSGERNVLFKMKELWSYFSKSFDEPEKYMKKIKKSEKLRDYEAAVGALLANCRFKEGIRL